MSHSQIFNLLASKKTCSRFLACNTLPPEFLARNKNPLKTDSMLIGMSRDNVKYNFKVVSEYLRSFGFSQLLWNDSFDVPI